MRLHEGSMHRGCIDWEVQLSARAHSLLKYNYIYTLVTSRCISVLPLHSSLSKTASALILSRPSPDMFCSGHYSYPRKPTSGVRLPGKGHESNMTYLTFFFHAIHCYLIVIPRCATSFTCWRYPIQETINTIWSILTIPCSSRIHFP